MRLLISIFLLLYMTSCGQAVPKGNPQERELALSEVRPKNPGHKVFYFSLDAEDSNARNLWIDRKRVCVLSRKTFCRVELAEGPHYFETIFSNNKSAMDSVRGFNWKEEGKRSFVESVSLKLLVSKKDNGPVLINMFLKGYTHPKYNFLSYYPFHKSKPILGKEEVLPRLEGYSYSKPLLSSISDTYVTPEDQKQWEMYGNTNSVDSLKDFQKKFPRNVYAALLIRRLEEKEQEEEKTFRRISKNPSLKKWEDFITTNPAKDRRDTALKNMVSFLKSSKSRRVYAAKYPSLVPFLPDDERETLSLLGVGPSELKVSDIIELSKKGFATSTLASKIKASQSLYKNFSFEEISRLKTLGVKSQLIDAMIDANTTYEAEIKRARENKELMAKVQALISKSQSSVGAQDIKNNPNTPVECLKQKAALEACKQTSGFLKVACETTAKASFDCSL